MQPTQVDARHAHPAPPRLTRRAAALLSASAGILLAACRSGAAPVAGPQPTAVVTGKVVLWNPSAFPFDQDIGADLVKEFEGKNPGITISPETVAGTDPFSKFLTASAGGVPPDLCHAGSYQVQELAASSLVRPVDPYLKASSVIKQADIWATLIRDITYQGQQYAMPFAPDVRIMYTNTQVFLQSGLDPTKPPKTWTELEDTIRRTYRAEGGQATRLGFPPFWGSGGNYLWLVPFWQLGGETLSTDGTRVAFNEERGIQALQWLYGLHQLQGGYDVMQQLRAASTPNAHFVQGRLACYFATFSERKNQEFREAPGLQFNFTAWPLPPSGRRVNYGGCHSFYIAALSKVPDAAWRFLEFFANEDVNIRYSVRYDRIPIRIKTGDNPAYHQNDPFLKLALEEMAVRRFVPAAPGGTEALTVWNVMVNDVMAGKTSPRDALAETAQKVQLILDKWKK
jgi:multiple sugar transport system substrate-binding protein